MPLLKLNFYQFVCGAECTCFVGLFLGFVDHNTLIIIIHYCIIYRIRTYVYTIQYIIILRTYMLNITCMLHKLVTVRADT